MKDKVETMNELSKLCVTIGVFFSNCDGSFEPSEKQFLEYYVEHLGESLKPTFDSKVLIEDDIKNRPSFDEVVSVTNDFLSKFDDNERTAIRGTLAVLIDEIIKVGGDTDSKETK